MSLKALSLLLFVGLLAHSFAQKYQLSRTAVIFGRADGLAISLLKLLATKNFETAFVFNGQHQYDSDKLIPEYATQVIECSMVDTEYQNCEALVAYASASKPLDVIIDLQTDSAAEVNAIFNLFKATRKPRIYTVLSSHALYTPCRDTADARELVEFICPPMGDTVLPNSGDIHESEYELGRRALETERELYRLQESQSLSYLALRVAPLIGDREPVETSVNGAKKARLLTLILLTGVSAHLNQTIQVPDTFRNKKWSVLHTEDLVKMAFAIDLLANLPATQPFARTYNVASDRVTLKKFIMTLASTLNLKERPRVEFVDQSTLTDNARSLFYPDFYPPTQSKPINIEFVQRELRYIPSEFSLGLSDTVPFYRQLLVQFDAQAAPTHADEPVRVAIDTLVNAGLFTREQIDEFLDALRNQKVDEKQENPAAENESESGEKREPHTEL